MSSQHEPPLPRPAGDGARSAVAAVVAVAMEVEAQPFLEALPLIEEGPALPTCTGARAWRLALPAPSAPSPDSPQPGELVLLRTGIGLVAAASALATALTRVRPGVIVSAGTAGGLGYDVEVGDVCASQALAFTDADATAFGYARGQTPGQPETFPGDASLLERLSAVGPQALGAATPSSAGSRLRTGLMLAGNSFVTAANVADTREVFPRALSTDMESTALAQVAAGAEIPFLAVRGISDLCGPQAGQDFHIEAEEAAARSAAAVLALLA